MAAASGPSLRLRKGGRPALFALRWASTFNTSKLTEPRLRLRLRLTGGITGVWSFFSLSFSFFPVAYSHSPEFGDSAAYCGRFTARRSLPEYKQLPLRQKLIQTILCTRHAKSVDFYGLLCFFSCLRLKTCGEGDENSMTGGV